MNHTTETAIRNKLNTMFFLRLLMDAGGDSRGLELADALEREAHALYRAAGYDDRPTADLMAMVRACDFGTW
jgi:hypothetical protein